jgi:ATP-dependent helicase/nuclease subunit A
VTTERLPFDDRSLEARIDARDRDGRARAVDPRFNVALEASAGTGKTRVLVDRYINLLREGVDPTNILAITFTRKAAADMRERIVATLRAAAARGEIAPSRWRDLRDRMADINISTIDAFCLSLLREFPLEADVDPGFSLADDTEVPRLVDESLDRALRVCRAVAREDEHVALVFAQLGDRRLRAGLGALLNRRIVAPAALSRYLAKGPRDLSLATAAHRGAAALLGVFQAMRGGLDRFLDTGPLDPVFLLLAKELRALEACLENGRPLDPAAVHLGFARAREHVLTQDGEPRTRLPFPKTAFASASDWRTHRDLVTGHAAAIASAFAGFRRDLNVLVSRGVWRMFRIADTEYQRTLEAHAVLDFSDVLLRALALLRQMEEFAQSRYRLEARYHHVLVDEFQDTSRAQWELISLLVRSWGEGAGLSYTGPLQPSIFIVGDRKQSIYGFRNADVSVLGEASRHLEALRPGGDVRRSISRSFRSVPALLAFINDLFHDVDKVAGRRDAFRYDEPDRFPAAVGDASGQDVLAMLAAETPDACAEIAADEIERLMAAGATVRDRDTGMPRPVRPGDVAILFRTRESHREFEEALERRGIPAYVYKGLGFFDADEIKDVLALLWYLADPASDLRAAAWLRSRFVRMSDEGLRVLAPRLADALTSPRLPACAAALAAADAAGLDLAREASSGWRALVDRVPPAELLDHVLTDSAYVAEMRGPRFQQARENLKKIRALVRRMQNRGYATLGRITSHLDRLAVGEEANAVVDATDAVNLMTVHAAKGLEFPVVFVVNLARGTGNRRDPIRVNGLEGDLDAGDGGLPEDSVSVSVGDFLSDADEDETTREKEETKRLLYVALTRARDRLYLASVHTEGRMQPGRGSLAEVLPPSIAAHFAEAAAGRPVVHWRASSGAVHSLRVCSGSAANQGAGARGAIAVPPAPGWTSPGREASVAGNALSTAIAGDFAALEDGGRQRQSVLAATSDAGVPHVAVVGRESDRLVGTLVHRMLQRFGLGEELDETTIVPRAAALLRDGEAASARADVSGLAALAYRLVCGRADVRDLYGRGEAIHVVPFTMAVDDGIVRGTIDCVVCRADGGVSVLEFKTGRPRPDHLAQVELYRKAAEAVFPGSAVDVKVVYAEEVDAR